MALALVVASEPNAATDARIRTALRIETSVELTR